MEIKLDELKHLYYNNKNEDVCNQLGISMVTLIKLLDDNNIERKGKGNAYHRNSVKVVK